jgi:hypothetical protein
MTTVTLLQQAGDGGLLNTKGGVHNQTTFQVESGFLQKTSRR